MVQRYTAIALRVLCAVSMIAASAQVHAGAHGAMAKRHNLSCKQLFMAALFGAAAVNGNMECVSISGSSNGSIIKLNGVCGDSSRTSRIFNRESYVAGALSVASGHPIDSVSIQESAPCRSLEIPAADPRLHHESRSCIPLHAANRSDVIITPKTLTN